MNTHYVFDGKEYDKNQLKEILDNISNVVDERVLKTLDMLEGKEILDVGCSIGSLSKNIVDSGFKVTGIDVLEESIKIANEFYASKNSKFEVRDLINQPFPENSFDCITFLETIEHVLNPALFLKEFHRILKNNGCVILSTPNATSLKNILYALSYNKKEKRRQLGKEIASENKNTGTQSEHVYNWDFPTLARLLDRCGFDIVESEIVRIGPIKIPIFGKKRQILKINSKFLSQFPSLKTTHVIKARKRIE
jgi:ubiquinone/menaquinone biosynthesis C-methylase UbiE